MYDQSLLLQNTSMDRELQLAPLAPHAVAPLLPALDLSGDRVRYRSPQARAAALTALLTLAPEILPSAARENLCALWRAGTLEVYQSPHTSEWMVWQVLAEAQAGRETAARKTIQQWVTEFLQSQP